MCQGLLEESDGEGELGEGQDEGPEAGDLAARAEASPAPSRPAALEKKTEQQRRREKAARMLVSTAGPGLPLPGPQPVSRGCLGSLKPLGQQRTTSQPPLGGHSGEHSRSSPCPRGADVWGEAGEGCVSRRDKWVRVTKVGSGNSHCGDRPVTWQWVARAGGIWPGP